MMPRTIVMIRFSPRSSGTAFTFIAPTGFEHPETRAHVRLLGPCFKTGRMEPYGRQHPRRVVCEHRRDRQAAVRAHRRAVRHGRHAGPIGRVASRARAATGATVAAELYERKS